MYRRSRRVMRRLMFCCSLLAVSCTGQVPAARGGETLAEFGVHADHFPAQADVAEFRAPLASAAAAAPPVNASHPPLRDMPSFQSASLATPAADLSFSAHRLLENQRHADPALRDPYAAVLGTHDSSPIRGRMEAQNSGWLSDLADSKRAVAGVTVTQVTQPSATVSTWGNDPYEMIVAFRRWCKTTLEYFESEPVTSRDQTLGAVGVVPFVDFDGHLDDGEGWDPRWMNGRRTAAFKSCWSHRGAAEVQQGSSFSLEDAQTQLERPHDDGRRSASVNGADLLRKELDALALEEPIDVQLDGDLGPKQGIRRMNPVSEEPAVTAKRLNVHAARRQLIGGSPMIVRLDASEEYVPYDLARSDAPPSPTSWSRALRPMFDQPLCVDTPSFVRSRLRRTPRTVPWPRQKSGPEVVATAEHIGLGSLKSEADGALPRRIETTPQTPVKLSDEIVKHLRSAGGMRERLVSELRPDMIGGRAASLANQSVRGLGRAAGIVASSWKGVPRKNVTAGTRLLARAGASEKSFDEPAVFAETEFAEVLKQAKRLWSYARSLGQGTVRIADAEKSGKGY